MANEKMALSPAGWRELRQREGAEYRYYNDAANHCTYGIGTLVHKGPCTEEELKTPVSEAKMNASLARRIQHAERAVRRQVRSIQLTQAQFDSLVSFTFNVGARGAQRVLEAADRGEHKEVASLLSQYVYVYPRDANGKRLPPRRLQGLVARRQEEAKSFQLQGDKQ